MVEKSVEISNPLGLHARSAALIVQTASKFNSHISFAKGEKRVNAKSVMGLMSMAVAQGMEILISAEGDDEVEALNTLEKLITTDISV